MNIIPTVQHFLTQHVPAHARLAVAVSGGGDSVALLRVLHSVLGPGRLVALHLNHKLRLAADDEACWVKELCTSLNIPFVCHTWDAVYAGNLQQAARHARYNFFAECVQTMGLHAVCVAHTQDDIAETLVMRLGRGSGLTGLAAMQPVVRLSGVLVLRPVLGVSRQDLRTYLESLPQLWLEDPSNTDPHYLRSRVREGIATLDDIGLPSRALADAAHALRRANEALDVVTNDFLKNFTNQAPDGGVVVASYMLEQPDEIAQRVMEKVILKLKPAPLAPRVSKRLRALAALREGAKQVELGGVIFTQTRMGLEARQSMARLS